MYYLFYSWIICTIFSNRIFAQNLEDIFANNEFVPNVIPEAPNTAVQVTFPSGCIANFGNQLTPVEVHDQPTVQWDFDPSKQYALVMTDPDAPSRLNPYMAEWCHWIVVNIPNGNVADGEPVYEFIPSAPSNNTGLHRYLILIYEQPQDGMTYDDMVHLNNLTSRGRDHFSVRRFAKRYNLGTPVAGNFYQAAYDDSVPATHRLVGIDM